MSLLVPKKLGEKLYPNPGKYGGKSDEKVGDEDGIAYKSPAIVPHDATG